MPLDQSFGMRKTDAILGWLAIASIWIAAHPYNGAWHDAQLYTAQALYHLKPENFAHDLFFLFASQDNYSFFGPLYARVIGMLGLDAAVLAMTWAGQLLWLGAGACLLRCLAPDRRVFWLALLLLCALPGQYGYVNLISYGESFVTARLYAEAAVLLALALALKRRWAMSSVAIGVALLLHPLMGLPALLLLMIYALPLRAVALVFLAGALGALALAAWPASAPLVQDALGMDRHWYALTVRRAPYLALHNWRMQDWAPVALNVLVLLCTWFVAEGKLRRFFFAVLGATLICMAAALIGGTVHPIALLLQLQLWRVLWLTQWVAMFAYAWFVVTQWNVSPWGRVAALLLLGDWLTLSIGAGAPLAPLAALIVMLPAGHRHQVSARAWAIVMLTLGCCLLSFLYIYGYRAGVLLAAFARDQRFAGAGIPLLQFFQIGTGALLVPVLFIAWRRAGAGDYRHSRAILTVLICALSALTLYHWNAREPSFLRGMLPGQHDAYAGLAPFRAAIPDDGVVYWIGGDALHSWFLLNRASYVSRSQTAGIVFSKRAAFEAERRALHIRPLSLGDALAAMVWEVRLDRPFPRPARAATGDELRAVCQDPALGFVIAPAPVGGQPYAARWDAAALGEQFFLYDCRGMRRHA